MAAEEQFNLARFIRLLGCFLLLSLGIFLALALSGGPYNLIGYGLFALVFVLFVACSGSLSWSDRAGYISGRMAELERQKSRHFALFEKIKVANDDAKLTAIEQEIKASSVPPQFQHTLEKMVEARRQMLQFDTLIERAESVTNEEEQAKLLADLEAFGRTMQRDKNKPKP